jgi:hypothetical protein
MATEQYREIELHLNTLHELFVVPPEDPFVEKIPFVPGIEMIKTALRSQPGRLRTRTTIFLPPENIEPDMAEKTRIAVRRFCRFKSQQNKNTMKTLRGEAYRALIAGILFLTAGLLLASAVETMTFIPSLLRTLLSDGFDIAFWVILWRPVDFFLFDLLTYKKNEQIYDQLMQMEIVIAQER